ncbi:hypothetical protein DPMN_059482 [Dreissena polymorpha]|uniref:Uncharacterized protein n=1 Tax=Dreissena polymorpha TaxID=45954 RepID=A0A9D4C3K4_DREPO|nr:hypothetical protein DPMN_059482 [Dreissena polymorpha]
MLRYWTLLKYIQRTLYNHVGSDGLTSSQVLNNTSWKCSNWDPTGTNALWR